MNNFKIWLDNASGDQLEELAKRALTTSAYLRHIATDRREPSADMAGRIETALNKMGIDSVTRADLNDACAECPYFKQCKAQK